MTKPIITIHNLETNEIIEREMNAAEYAQYQIDQEAIKNRAKAEADKAAAKASAQAKLAALGLTADEVAAIVGNQPKRVASI